MLYPGGRTASDGCSSEAKGDSVPLQDEQPALGVLLGPSEVKQPVLAVSSQIVPWCAGSAVLPQRRQPALAVSSTTEEKQPVLAVSLWDIPGKLGEAAPGFPGQDWKTSLVRHLSRQARPCEDGFSTGIRGDLKFLRNRGLVFSPKRDRPVDPALWGGKSGALVLRLQCRESDKKQ